MNILLMEDDPVLGDIVSAYLDRFYKVIHVYDFTSAMEEIINNKFDLFIFDINVPGGNGIELLKEIRAFNNQTPTIIVTAYNDTSYLKNSFGAGANDYIRKPFELEELKVRIDNICKVFNIDNDGLISIDDNIIFDVKKQEITNGLEKFSLSPKESELLEYFIGHKNRLIPSEELLQNLWSFESMPTDATLRSYIRKLRAAIGNEKIVTQRGVGYRYE